MKYLSDFEIKLTTKLSIVTAIISILVSFIYGFTIFNFLIGISFGLAAFLYMIQSYYFLNRKHVTFIRSRKSQKLLQEFNLEVEKRDNYHGLKGYVNNYFIRIYFDPKHLTNGGIKVMIYFKPPSIDGKTLDNKTIERLESRYNIIFRQVRIVEASHFILSFDSIFTKRIKHISNKIFDTISICLNEGLNPISEKKIEYLINNDVEYPHYPEIETFEKSLPFEIIKNHSENNYQNT